MDSLYFVVLILFTCLFCSIVTDNSKKDIEVIKNTKDYRIYKHCRSIDDVYYCYDEVINEWIGRIKKWFNI